MLFNVLMETFTVEGPSYTQVNHFIDSQFYINQHSCERQKESVTETLGCHWGLFYNCHTEDETNFVYFRSGNEYIKIEKNDVVFIPPYSIYETKVGVGIKYNFTSLTSSWPLSHSFKQPFINKTFLHKLNEKISRETVLNFFESATSKLDLKQEKIHNPSAIDFKRIIDTSYTKKNHIKDLTEQQGLSRVSITKSFSNTYGISPNKYLNLLKIFKALYYMNNGFSILSASSFAGYSDPARFNTNFKKHFGVTAKSFKF